MRRLFLAVLMMSAFTSRGAEGIARLEFMVGEWRGTSRGQPGEGTVQRTCTKVLRDRFIECRSVVSYASGEKHVELALYSYDKGAKKLRLRQFHGEGFVNTYEETEPLVFETTAIENIPAGWRARESYEQPSADQWKERFELAQPGREFAVYTTGALERVK